MESFINKRSKKSSGKGYSYRAIAMISAIVMIALMFGNIGTCGVNAEETIDIDAITANFPETVTIPQLDTTDIGNNIQRTMTLLETSTIEHPNTVRIAFYGQSMIDPNNAWPQMLIDSLKTKYPTANIISKNLAVGGFAAGFQRRMVEFDMKEFYPDLTLYYASGDYNSYAEIVKYLRTYTTSEVMFFNSVSHNAVNYDLEGVNGTAIPRICEYYKCELVDAYSMFFKFYEINKNKDGTPLSEYYCFNPPPKGHFNANGQRVMAEIIKQFFVYKPVAAEQSWKVNRMTTLEVGKDVNWENGQLNVDIEGNRYEVVLGKGNTNKANVLVNGKKPSEFFDLYYQTRIYDNSTGAVDPFWYRGGWLKIDLLKIPTVQEWTIELTAADEATQSYTYSLTGSKSGDEGSGNSEKVFVDKSRDMSIDPEDAFTAGGSTIRNTDGSETTAFYVPGNKYKFETKLNGIDTIIGKTDEEQDLVVASGLKDVSNKLSIVAEDATKLPDIKAIRVYRPKVENDAVDKPKGMRITDNNKLVEGKALAKSLVYAVYGDKSSYAEVDENGEFMLTLPCKIPAGKKVMFYANNFNDKSEMVYVKAMPRKPVVKKVTLKSKTIDGTVSPKANVLIKLGRLKKSLKANAKGKFTMKLNKKWKKALKAKAKITVTSKINRVSSVKTIKVAKK